MSEESSSEINNPWANMLESQQAFFDTWRNGMQFLQPENMQNNFTETCNKMTEEWRDSQKNMMSFASNPQEVPQKMNKLFQDWTKPATKNLKEVSKLMPTPVGQDAFGKMFEDSNIYSQLFDFWNRFFIKPWLDASCDLYRSSSKVMQGDRNAYFDFIKTWQQAFQDSTGKLLNMPSLGFSRKTNEKVLKSFDAYLAYINSANEFTFSLYTVGYDAMNKIINYTKEENGNTRPPESFKEFYDLWIKINEEAFLKLFKQESFAKLLGNLVDTGISFKRRYDDLVMEALNQLPIPTDNDMDSVYKKIYELNKEVKYQRNVIEELREKFEEMESKKTSKKTKAQ